MKKKIHSCGIISLLLYDKINAMYVEMKYFYKSIFIYKSGAVSNSCSILFNTESCSISK